MALSVGIVGLPNVGKSTVFNALTAGKAEAANYPFCTIDPNVGVVPVPDARLKRIESHIKTQKVIPAIVEIVDIAGLVKGASEGGLGSAPDAPRGGATGDEQRTIDIEQDDRLHFLPRGSSSSAASRETNTASS